MIALLICFLSLGIGEFLIRKIKFLQKYSLPSSLIMSVPFLIGFNMISGAQTSPLYLAWKDWPGITIALVFAALFLQKGSDEDSKTENKSEVFAQTGFVFAAVLGQMAIGVLLTLILFGPVFHLPLAFSSVLENGFAGGHGTAVAMKQSYMDNHLPEGVEYALFSATVGIACGIIGGVILVGNQKKNTVQSAEPESKLVFSFNQFMVVIGLISLAVFTGFIGKTYMEKSFQQFPEMPLFVYSLAVSVAFKYILSRLGLIELLDEKQMTFFSNFFMEIMIFTAIATMNLSVISVALTPLLILFTAGFIWNLFCHFWLRHRMLPKAFSFELSILNFGMLNGTTAIGLMLLRMMDPELKSRGVKVYAESAPITSIFVGGGVLSLSLPYLLNKNPPFLILAFLIIGVLVSAYVGIKFKNKAEISARETN